MLRSLKVRQRGVGLIEVLIAVLVLAFGMLGLVSLQLFTLKNNQSSFERGLAVVQTHSIVDAMRADRTNAVNKKFDIAMGAKAPTGSSFPEVAVATWRANLTAELGDGASGSVVCDGSLCTIVIQWNDERGGGSNAEQVETTVQL